MKVKTLPKLASLYTDGGDDTCRTLLFSKFCYAYDRLYYRLYHNINKNVCKTTKP